MLGLHVKKDIAIKPPKLGSPLKLDIFINYEFMILMPLHGKQWFSPPIGICRQLSRVSAMPAVIITYNFMSSPHYLFLA